MELNIISSLLSPFLHRTCLRQFVESGRMKVNVYTGFFDACQAQAQQHVQVVAVALSN